MRKVNLILVMLLIIFGTTELIAQQKGKSQRPNPEKVLNLLDKDKDGKISKDEAEQAPRKYLADNFDYFDTNEDKYIDLEELKSSDYRCRHAKHNNCNDRRHRCNGSRHHGSGYRHHRCNN